jgi:N-acyl homoserine lactone hydrolase
VSVIVRGSPSFLLAGDTSYNQQLLLEEVCDGVSPDPAVTLETLRRIRRLAEEEPLVYLPSHDPESAERLARASLLSDLTAATARSK